MTLSPDQFFGVQDSSVVFGQRDHALVPFPSAGRSKKLKDYDQTAVDAAIDKGETAPVDPRVLHAMQPSVTRAGVEHYMENPDVLYADKHQAGNQHPVVYRRVANDKVTHLLLSGHHRATAALLKGTDLNAVIAEGGWGPSRR